MNSLKEHRRDAYATTEYEDHGAEERRMNKLKDTGGTPMLLNLALLQPGQRAKIIKIGARGPMKRRLMDMGVLVGEVVRLEKVAPLGDPLEITVKSYKLSLRKSEAEGIEVEVLQ